MRLHAVPALHTDRRRVTRRDWSYWKDRVDRMYLCTHAAVRASQPTKGGREQAESIKPLPRHYSRPQPLFSRNLLSPCFTSSTICHEREHSSRLSVPPAAASRRRALAHAHAPRFCGNHPSERRSTSLATKHLADLLNMSNQLQSDDIPTAKPSTAPLPVPSKENDWLGFCQSAIKLQNGDRKVNLSTAKVALPSPGPY